MPLIVQRIADHEVIEVLMPRPYQPYEYLILRDPSAGHRAWTVLECEQKGDAWEVTATRCLEGCQMHRRRRWSLARTGCFGNLILAKPKLFS